MNHITNSPFTFLIVVNQFWAKGKNLIELKKECRANGVKPKNGWAYRGFLVHEDTFITDMGDIEFPNAEAASVAIDLGDV